MTAEETVPYITLSTLRTDVGVVELQLRDLPADGVDVYGLVQLIEEAGTLVSTARARLAETGGSLEAVCSYDLLLTEIGEHLRVFALTDRARNSAQFYWGDPDEGVDLVMDVIALLTEGPYTMRVPRSLVGRTRDYLARAESLMWGRARDLVELVELEDGGGVVRPRADLTDGGAR
jgi:hypothetical protein